MGGCNVRRREKLDNLVVIVDNNDLQIDGRVGDVNTPYPIDKKFEAFNFHVINVADGNDFEQLKAAFDEAHTVKRYAGGDHRENPERKRSFLYGGSGGLARKSSER